MPAMTRWMFVLTSSICTLAGCSVMQSMAFLVFPRIKI